MQQWIKRGFQAIRSALRKHGPPATPQHMKLAPQPPEGLFRKFVAGRVISFGYFQKSDGNPHRKPKFVNVYIRLSGTTNEWELVVSNVFNPTVDLDGSYGVGCNVDGAPPGQYDFYISSLNDYGETVCITPATVKVGLA